MNERRASREDRHRHDLSEDGRRGRSRKASSAARIARGLLDVRVHDLRDFTTDRHQVVDDVPFGGGPGMVMKPEPLFAAVDAIRATRGEPAAVVLTTPDGRRFSHARGGAVAPAWRTSWCCAAATRASTSGSGEHWRPRSCRSATTCCRAASCRRWSSSTRWRGWCRASSATSSRWKRDSFARGLLDYPQYTRPAEFAGMARAARCCCRGITARSAVAPARGAAADVRAAAGSAGRRRVARRRGTRGCCEEHACANEREGSKS